MTAEQLLEQMEVFEKSRKEFIEFEKSHRTVFKTFLQNFGFSESEVKDIISGNISKIAENKDSQPNEINTKNEILKIFTIYHEISENQLTKIDQIIENGKSSADEEAKAFHFENLAKTINDVPIDYYRKVKTCDDEKNEVQEENKQKNIVIEKKSSEGKQYKNFVIRKNQSESIPLNNIRQNQEKKGPTVEQSKSKVNITLPNNSQSLDNTSSNNSKTTSNIKVDTNNKRKPNNPQQRSYQINTNQTPPPPAQNPRIEKPTGNNSTAQKSMKVEKSSGAKLQIDKPRTPVSIQFSSSGQKNISITKKPK